MGNEKKLNFVILGLLSHESLTGYEIKRRIDISLRFFWSASFGSIYPSLNEMVDDGLVTKLDAENDGRGRVIYTITEKGTADLKYWLAQPATKDEMRYETLLKLFFGGELTPEISLEHIRNFESRIRHDLPQLQDAVERLTKVKDQGEDHKYFLLTAMFGKMAYEAYLAWCKDAVKILEDN